MNRVRVQEQHPCPTTELLDDLDPALVIELLVRSGATIGRSTDGRLLVLDSGVVAPVGPRVPPVGPRTCSQTAVA